MKYSILAGLAVLCFGAISIPNSASAQGWSGPCPGSYPSYLSRLVNTVRVLEQADRMIAYHLPYVNNPPRSTHQRHVSDPRHLDLTFTFRQALHTWGCAEPRYVLQVSTPMSVLHPAYWGEASISRSEFLAHPGVRNFLNKIKDRDPEGRITIRIE